MYLLNVVPPCPLQKELATDEMGQVIMTRENQPKQKQGECAECVPSMHCRVLVRSGAGTSTQWSGYCYIVERVLVRSGAHRLHAKSSHTCSS